MLTEWILQGIAFITQDNATGYICQYILAFLVIPVGLLWTLYTEKHEERQAARRRPYPSAARKRTR